MGKDKKKRGFWGWILWILLLPVKLVIAVIKWIIKAPFRIVGSTLIFLLLIAGFIWLVVF